MLEKYSTLQFLRDLWGFVKSYKANFFIGFFLRFTSDLANLYPTWAVSQIVVLLTSQNYNPSSYYTIFGTWIFLAIYIGIGHNLSKYFGYQVAEAAAIDAKFAGLKHIYTLDLAWQEAENSGNKMKRIDHGRRAIDQIIRLFFQLVIESSITVVSIIVIFASIDYRISLCMAIFMITYFVLSLKLTKRASRQAQVVNRTEESVEGLTFESLNNIKTIKALGMKDSIVQNLSDTFKQLNFEIKNRIKLFQTRGIILNTYYMVFQVIMVIFIVYSIIRGEYIISVLVLFIGYIKKVEEAVSELSEVSHELVINQIQLSRLVDILKVKPTIETFETQESYPSDWINMQLKNISFSYGDDKVLADLNFDISRGEKIGIVGLSGAGKSTLFKLLMDLYEDYEGEILIGHKSLKHIDRLNYIDNVSVVLQDTELFNASLKDNILLAGRRNQQYDYEKLQESIKISHLDEVVYRLPDGMETIIGEKGIKLSGGERQRLGIARALYRDPDLLLLDEATSHLDVNSERKIQDSLNTFFKKVTAIVIAHRLSTIKEMDRIIVLQKGNIIEQGTFDELIALNGAFKEMWEKQKL